MTQSTGSARPGRVTRRAEYAETTRRAIVAAARTLFSEKGYFATKVDEIAATARVAPATVYAVTGGKQGLLRTLVDEWSDAPVVAEARAEIAKLDDAEELLSFLAALTRSMRQDYGDIMRLVIAAAPHDATAAEGLATGTARYRDGTLLAAQRLADLGALRDGLTVEEALDILWFYFGYAGFFTLVDDNGWSYPKAEEWLRDAARRALLAEAASE
ncbi:TetR/AcrR family transcriptional regulator [Pseudonocardia xinjiangensis]|uniref:TetR/AcrR family transcriptional regulator n=1 Tax=Pseudonocardia xinjiangensis TaxID=75289 RepID=UPI0028ADD53F|nr:TetR/AcrR family transcriptional regulator [Pseudonocardia xinjiangensis]